MSRPVAERLTKHSHIEPELAAMSSPHERHDPDKRGFRYLLRVAQTWTLTSVPHDRHDPDKRVFWYLKTVARTIGADLGRSKDECNEAASHGSPVAPRAADPAGSLEGGAVPQTL